MVTLTQIREGKFITPADSSKTRDSVMKQLVSEAKKYFKHSLSDKDCSVSYEVDKDNPKVAYLTLVHHDLMDALTEASDAADLVSLAKAHTKVDTAKLAHRLKMQPSFREYRAGAMPSIVVEVKIV